MVFKYLLATLVNRYEISVMVFSNRNGVHDPNFESCRYPSSLTFHVPHTVHSHSNQDWQQAARLAMFPPKTLTNEFWPVAKRLKANLALFMHRMFL